jgi:hypothetical protein
VKASYTGEYLAKVLSAQRARRVPKAAEREGGRTTVGV